ncbi:DUF2812 domain-containing protein [Romboutsia weinsteinii]|uniref:DUF2812 domain-containing protein n=1 Tax=Romboutsia weinsteinii TaxID=2020949 RepID=A0A371J298_9FIRM|nr:DUF2812 domain-containing protein [Romboutsia weinsteinii]RDY26942.1 DUF2812 domain-containing protein [Romboutsia weinsteinii]
MLQKIHKLYCSYEKEEQWLNEMAAKGMMLKNYTFGTYYFEKDIPGKYIYRIELLENAPNHTESRVYIEFMEDTGVEYISSYMNWVYFRKKSDEGEFDLYSDLDSKIKHYNRILQLTSIIFYVNLIAMFVNLYIGLVAMINNNIYSNLVFASISLIVSLIIGRVRFSYKKKVKKLKKEKQLVE